MNDVSLAIARNMFHLQIHEADGQRFEDLFSKIMSYKSRDFQPVKPYGNIGDRKNDGWIQSENTYYQVYAPSNIEKSINDAVNKYKNHEDHFLEHKEIFSLYECLAGNMPRYKSKLTKKLAHHHLDIVPHSVNQKTKRGYLVDQWRATDGIVEAWIEDQYSKSSSNTLQAVS